MPGVSGPQASIRYNEKAHTGSLALMYSGSAKGGASDYAYMRVFDTSPHPPTIDSGTTLSYWIYPSSSAVNGVTGNNSTCVALDMDFADGTQLRNLGARDQNGNVLHPARQCGHLVLDQWNHVTVDIGAVAERSTAAMPAGTDTHHRGVVA